jgi:hypothetical protein
LKLKGFLPVVLDKTPQEILAKFNGFLGSIIPNLPEHLKAVSSSHIIGRPLFCKVFFNSQEAAQSAIVSIGSRQLVLFGCKITGNEPSNLLLRDESDSTSAVPTPVSIPTPSTAGNETPDFDVDRLSIDDPDQPTNLKLLMIA